MRRQFALLCVLTLLMARQGPCGAVVCYTCDKCPSPFDPQNSDVQVTACGEACLKYTAGGVTYRSCVPSRSNCNLEGAQAVAKFPDVPVTYTCCKEDWCNAAANLRDAWIPPVLASACVWLLQRWN